VWHEHIIRSAFGGANNGRVCGGNIGTISGSVSRGLH